MNDGALDIAILVIMAYFFLRGIFRGLVKEVVAVVGLFAAFWIAGIYWPIGAEHLVVLDENPSTRAVLSFLIIFLIVYFIIGLISIFADKIVKLTISPFGSAILGAVIGTLKGVLMVAILLGAAETFLRSNNPLFATSAIWPVAKPIVAQVKSFAPEALRKLMDSKPSILTGLLDSSAENAQGQAAPQGLAALSPVNVDWKKIQGILETNPDAISPAWRDKLRSIQNGAALSAEDIKRFIQDNPGLFTAAGATKEDAPVTAPQWAIPAGD